MFLRFVIPVDSHYYFGACSSIISVNYTIVVSVCFDSNLSDCHALLGMFWVLNLKLLIFSVLEFRI